MTDQSAQASNASPSNVGLSIVEGMRQTVKIDGGISREEVTGYTVDKFVIKIEALIRELRRQISGVVAVQMQARASFISSVSDIVKLASTDRAMTAIRQVKLLEQTLLPPQKPVADIGEEPERPASPPLDPDFSVNIGVLASDKVGKISNNQGWFPQQNLTTMTANNSRVVIHDLAGLEARVLKQIWELPAFDTSVDAPGCKLSLVHCVETISSGTDGLCHEPGGVRIKLTRRFTVPLPQAAVAAKAQYEAATVELDKLQQGLARAQASIAPSSVERVRRELSVAILGHVFDSQDPAMKTMDALTQRLVGQVIGDLALPAAAAAGSP